MGFLYKIGFPFLLLFNCLNASQLTYDERQLNEESKFSKLMSSFKDFFSRKEEEQEKINEEIILERKREEIKSKNTRHNLCIGIGMMIGIGLSMVIFPPIVHLGAVLGGVGLYPIIDMLLPEKSMVTSVLTNAYKGVAKVFETAVEIGEDAFKIVKAAKDFCTHPIDSSIKFLSHLMKNAFTGDKNSANAIGHVVDWISVFLSSYIVETSCVKLDHLTYFKLTQTVLSYVFSKTIRKKILEKGYFGIIQWTFSLFTAIVVSYSLREIYIIFFGDFSSDGKKSGLSNFFQKGWNYFSGNHDEESYIDKDFLEEKKDKDIYVFLLKSCSVVILLLYFFHKKGEDEYYIYQHYNNEYENQRSESANREKERLLRKYNINLSSEDFAQEIVPPNVDYENLLKSLKRNPMKRGTGNWDENDWDVFGSKIRIIFFGFKERIEQKIMESGGKVVGKEPKNGTIIDYNAVELKKYRGMLKRFLEQKQRIDDLYAAMNDANSVMDILKPFYEELY